MILHYRTDKKYSIISLDNQRVLIDFKVIRCRFVFGSKVFVPSHCFLSPPNFSADGVKSLMGSPKYIIIQSVTRAMKILEHLASSGGGQGVTAIAEAVGLNKSTCFGLIYTLQALGYVVQDKKTGGYRLGMKNYQLGQAYTEQLDLRRIAQPHLQELSQMALETVHLVIREGLHAVYIDKIEGPHAMRISSQLGQRVKMHCAGVGKAILAHFSDEELELALEKELTRYTCNTVTDLDALKKVLTEIRKKGLAMDNQEVELGLCCLAAPIFDLTGSAVAAISISGPTTRLTKKRITELMPCLKSAVVDISRQLGYFSIT